MKLFNNPALSGVIALVSGTLFGLGLVISGMTDTTKVIGFLNLFGQWDASLMFVMAAALAITVPAFHFISKRANPLLEDRFCLPQNPNIDARLLIGAVLFGIGWGLYGFCPGPAIVSLSSFNNDTLIFVATMLVGMAVAERLSRDKSH